MAIKESLYFSYDGIKSTDFDIMNVSLDDGLYDEPFLSSRTIREFKIRGRDEPYFQEIEYEPLQFTVSFYFDEGWDEHKIRKVARWLNQSYYKPLFFSENPNRIFYCLCIEEPRLIHNGLKEGYIELTFRCDSPYTYSPVYTSPVYNTEQTKEIELTNNGDVDCYPVIYLQKTNSEGNIEIKNYNQSGKSFILSNIDEDEELIIDGYNKDIETNKPLTYRYDNHNDYYLNLSRGVNRLELIGDFKVQFVYQFKTLQ